MVASMGQHQAKCVVVQIRPTQQLPTARLGQSACHRTASLLLRMLPVRMLICSSGQCIQGRGCKLSCPKLVCIDQRRHMAEHFLQAIDIPSENTGASLEQKAETDRPDAAKPGRAI